MLEVSVGVVVEERKEDPPLQKAPPPQAQAEEPPFPERAVEVPDIAKPGPSPSVLASLRLPPGLSSALLSSSRSRPTTDAIGMVAFLGGLTAAEQIALEPSFAAALQSRRLTSGASDPDAVALLAGVAWLAAAGGDLERADGEFGDALALIRRTGSSISGARAAPSADCVLLLCILAKLAQARGQLDEAQRYWEDALDGSRTLAGETNLVALEALRALALIATVRGGREPLAQRLFKQATDVVTRLEAHNTRPLPHRV